MIHLIDLTEAFVATLQAIPQLVADLAGAAPESVIGYLPTGAKDNQVGETTYAQLPGTVLVIWQETRFEPGSPGAWVHIVHFYVRPMRGQSPYTLIDDIVNGVPDPGDGQRWRLCPVMSGVYPTDVTEVSRPVDEEGIDYYTIVTETKETGDF